MRFVAILSLVFAVFTIAPSLRSEELPLGLVKDKPAEGPYVETDQGFMVPYEATIPGGDVKYQMLPIPGGTFKLGSPADEAKREKSEGPQVEIAVEPFWMGVYEITWGEYKQYMDMCDAFSGFQTHKMRPVTDENKLDAVTAPSNLYDPTFTFQSGSHPRQPALSMSQFAAKQYTKWLSLLTSRFYRLPSEAEWEYAARAGTTTAYSFGDDADKLDDYAWYFDNADDRTHKVGEKKPNPWGLYDMHGNVAEWVLDAYNEDGYTHIKGDKAKASDAVNWPTKLFPRVVRGGSWDFDPEQLRSAYRHPSSDDEWRSEDPNFPQSPWWFTSGDALGVGFRIIRPLSAPARADREKYWKADIPLIQDDADNRIDNEGRGSRGVVDGTLPAALKELAEKKQG
ncbi:MAG: formylglycine-generating enzyme family protein [Pirellulaceae bacterium]